MSGASSGGVRERVVEALKGVYDAEIPVSIYDLGLIREVHVDEAGRRARVKMLFTSGQMCPVADMMAVQVKYAVKRALPDFDVQVDVDLDTRWTPAMATPEGRRALEELFGKEYVEGLMTGRIKIKVKEPPKDFDPLAYMRQRVEERYRVFKEWLERTRVA